MPPLHASVQRARVPLGWLWVQCGCWFAGADCRTAAERGGLRLAQQRLPVWLGVGSFRKEGGLRWAGQGRAAYREHTLLTCTSVGPRSPGPLLPSSAAFSSPAALLTTPCCQWFLLAPLPRISPLTLFPFILPGADRGGVVVLMATNRPEALDPALMRPGRLDHLLRVPLPDQPARLSILRSTLRRCPLGADVALDELAGEPTRGMSGADLAEVCRRAGMMAIRELVAAEEAWLQQRGQQREGAAAASLAAPEPAPLQRQHLEAALATVRRSVSADESERHMRIEQQLVEGSLPSAAAVGEAAAGQEQGSQAQQAAVLQRVVSAAVQGSVERQLSRLQLRVRQLEELARSSGLELPPPPAVPAC